MSAPYHSGQSPWPDNQSQRPPPIQFRPEEQAPRDNSALAWTLRIIGLIAVAVVSGAVWWYIQIDDGDGSPTGYGGGTTQQQSAGKYEFTQELDSPRVNGACGDHAYGDTKQFLEENSCERLTRSVFTTSVDGRTIYTSVSVVEMADAATAEALRDKTDEDGSGNVNDLVREGEVKVKGLDTLSGNDGYASEVRGTRVTIVESDYDPKTNKDESGTQDVLDDVSRDALRLGADITNGDDG
ncbi:hypothetical protein [Actinophytocola sp.]|uniref:hypothetical protein n=1 Tax=Actinophytocola sp. TaxID=1872138 RepID=UPI003D6ACCDE